MTDRAVTRSSQGENNMSNNIAVSAAWDAVTKGAIKFATDQIDAKALHTLVVTYAEARNTEARASAPKAAPAATGGPIMPFGRSKGRPVASAPIDDVKWMLGVVVASVDDDSKARFRDNNLRLAEILQARVDAESGTAATGKTAAQPDPEDIPF